MSTRVCVRARVALSKSEVYRIEPNASDQRARQSQSQTEMLEETLLPSACEVARPKPRADLLKFVQRRHLLISSDIKDPDVPVWDWDRYIGGNGEGVKCDIHETINREPLARPHAYASPQTTS